MFEARDLRVTTADGIALAATERGAGPPVLMIPGLGAARRVYDPIVPLVAEWCRVVVYDPRGIGESGITDGPWTMHQLAADAVHVLDAAGVDTATVFGASMGGMVAQRLALDFPSRVERLILAATSPGGDHAELPDAAARDRLMGRTARTPGEAYRIACEVLYSEAFQHAESEFIEEQVDERARHPVRARAFTAQSRASATHATYDELPRIAAPTLILHGELDAVIPVRNAATLAGRILGSETHVFPGGGHLFFHESPVEAARMITDFVTAPR